MSNVIELLSSLEKATLYAAIPLTESLKNPFPFIYENEFMYFVINFSERIVACVVPY